MKNFDEQRRERLDRERTFVIGGETFHYRAGVRPEDILAWFQMRSGETVGPAAGEAALTQTQQIAVYDQTILAYLEPGQEEAWYKIRAVVGDDAITLSDLDVLTDWLLSEQAGRPTSQRSDSSPGDGSGATGTNSTASSLPVEETVSKT